jgi:hypothetical protein
MRSAMFSRKWWLAARERMAKTGAQTLIGMIGFEVTGFKDLNVTEIAIAVAVFMLLSLCTSIVMTPTPIEEQ